MLSISGAKIKIALIGVQSRARETLPNQLINTFKFILFCEHLLNSLLQVLSDNLGNKSTPCSANARLLLENS